MNLIADSYPNLNANSPPTSAGLNKDGGTECFIINSVFYMLTIAPGFSYENISKTVNLRVFYTEEDFNRITKEKCELRMQFS